MIRNIIFIALLFFPSLALANPATYMADRHAGYGIPCAACHQIEAPVAGAAVETDTCLTCHTSYEKVAALTTHWGEINPHNNHLGEVDCTVCHKGHEPSVSYCISCHEAYIHDMK